MHGLFITGTDTDVGKTWVSSHLAKHLTQNQPFRTGLYKPACSGALQDEAGLQFWPDLRALSEAVGNAYPLERICPQCFQAPLAPPVAAEAEGKTINEELLYTGVDWWKKTVDLLLIEGVGGWLCPLSHNEMIADFALKLGYPILIVARLGLGTINHTLLTIESIRARGGSVAGVVLNEAVPLESDESWKSNAQQIEHWGQTKVLATLRHGEEPSELFSPKIDWMKLAGE